MKILAGSHNGDTKPDDDEDELELELDEPKVEASEAPNYYPLSLH